MDVAKKQWVISKATVFRRNGPATGCGNLNILNTALLVPSRRSSDTCGIRMRLPSPSVKVQKIFYCVPVVNELENPFVGFPAVSSTPKLFTTTLIELLTGSGALGVNVTTLFTTPLFTVLVTR